MKKLAFSIFFHFSFLIVLVAQPDPKLAEQYFQNGELEKAAAIFEKLYQGNTGDYFFERYVTCLLDLSRFDEAERVIQKQIRKEPQKVTLYVNYGKLFDKQSLDAKANEQYKKAIDKLPADRFTIDNLAMNFNGMTRYDLAMLAYERGSVLLKNKNVFAFNLAELYRRKDDVPHMLEAYLNALGDNPAYLPSVEAMLMRYATTPDEQLELQTQLYTRIQEQPNEVVYVELLAWSFMQKKDYKSAFRQLKAIDRLRDEDGNRVFNLALIAESERDYESAIEGYAYITNDKGRSSPYFIEAKRNGLACKRKRLTEGYAYTTAELLEIETAYETFLTEVGRNTRTAAIVAELADLNAFYLKNLDKAVALLEELIAYPMVDKDIQSRAKLSLGDFFLIRGERWEATLLYSQVDKIYKDDILGHEARFRNAKLAYFFGDFEWAKTQFSVLKASTSKLIANDAIDRDVFIMDNLNQDSTGSALTAYTQAELLVFQNRFDDAFVKLDSLNRDYPGNSLEDDVIYLKAQIYTKLRQFDKSVAAYEKILSEFKEEIRADNALFELAELYQGPLGNKDKAKELYEKLFNDFSNSTLAVEARKRFRLLRGDKIEN
jgi:tetratricopeptide (TPR) repeat protein